MKYNLVNITKRAREQNDIDTGSEPFTKDGATWKIKILDRRGCIFRWILVDYGKLLSAPVIYRIVGLVYG